MYIVTWFTYNHLTYFIGPIAIVILLQFQWSNGDEYAKINHVNQIHTDKKHSKTKQNKTMFMWYGIYYRPNIRPNITVTSHESQGISIHQPLKCLTNPCQMDTQHKGPVIRNGFPCNYIILKQQPNSKSSNKGLQSTKVSERPVSFVWVAGSALVSDLGLDPRNKSPWNASNSVMDQIRQAKIQTFLIRTIHIMIFINQSGAEVRIFSQRIGFISMAADAFNITFQSQCIWAVFCNLLQHIFLVYIFHSP